MDDWRLRAVPDNDQSAIPDVPPQPEQGDWRSRAIADTSSPAAPPPSPGIALNGPPPDGAPNWKSRAIPDAAPPSPPSVDASAAAAPQPLLASPGTPPQPASAVLAPASPPASAGAAAPAPADPFTQRFGPKTPQDVVIDTAIAGPYLQPLAGYLRQKASDIGSSIVDAVTLPADRLQYGAPPASSDTDNFDSRAYNLASLTAGLARSPGVRVSAPSVNLEGMFDAESPQLAIDNPTARPFAEAPPPDAAAGGAPSGDAQAAPGAPDIARYMPGQDDVIMQPVAQPPAPPQPPPQPNRLNLAAMLNSDKTAEQIAALQAQAQSPLVHPDTVFTPITQQLGQTLAPAPTPFVLPMVDISPLEAQMKNQTADQLMNIISTGKNRRLIDAATAEYQARFPTQAEDDFKTAEINNAAAQVNQTPTDAQKEAGNYQKGHVWISGLDISIENPQGSLRTGTGPDGQPWSVAMPDHYGYVKKTEGADGDHMDVYVANGPERKYVYVVDQIDPATGLFDEHKVMLNYPSMDAATTAYKNAFSDGKGAARMGGLTEMTVPKFKEWLKNGNTSKPLSYVPPAPIVPEKKEEKPVEPVAYAAATAPQIGAPPPLETGIRVPPVQKPAAEVNTDVGKVSQTGTENTPSSQPETLKSPEIPPEHGKEAEKEPEKPAVPPETADEPPKEVPAEPEKPSEPRKSRLESVGEEMAGKRSQLIADLEAQPDAVKFAKAILRKTGRADVFPLLTPEGATSGTKAYAAAIRDNMHTFFEAVKENHGRTSRHQTVEQNFVDMHKRHSGEITKLAGDYVATLGELAEVFREPKTTTEAKAALQAALLQPNVVPEYQQSVENDDLTPLGKRLLKFFNKYGDRSYRSTFSFFRFFLPTEHPGSINDEKVLAQPKRPDKTLRRPPLDVIERVGLPEYRDGKDITPNEFKDAFGFRGVEIGEWVNAAEGQAHVNHAYDALRDLAGFLKTDPKNLSFGGRLGFAFGSRGHGDASAHFEPANMVINVTKTRGDGTVAHEWLHALDHVLSQDNHSREALNVFRTSLKRSLFDTDYYRKSTKEFLRGSRWWNSMKKEGGATNAEYFLKQLEKRSPHTTMQTIFFSDAQALGKDYWGNDAEILARSWEAFVYDTLNGSSPYLVNSWVADGNVTKDNGYRGSAFPLADERKQFNENYAELVKALRWNEKGPILTADYKGPMAFSKDKAKSIADELRGQIKDMLREIRDENAKDTHAGNVVTPFGEPGTETAARPENETAAGRLPDGENGGGRSDLSGSAEQSGAAAPAEGQSGAGGSGARSDDRGNDAIPAERGEYKTEDVKALDSADVTGKNFVIKPGALRENRGPKQKARDNIAAIKLLKEIEESGRLTTLADQTVLALYSGWGGIKNAFADTEGNFKSEWKEIGSELRDLLTPDEYRIARKTIQYAHYTSETVVRAMWNTLARMGFKSGAIFEPGMGIGNFPGMLPRPMAKKSTYAGIELDPMTARMARQLYPEYTVRNADYTAMPLGENLFDVVIGNPPFSDVKVRSDPKYASEAFPLHDYFFAKSMDALAPGGILAFITSRYSLDRIDPTARKGLAEKADLLGAVRLPNTAFKANANTEVVTDILFFRKRKEGEKSVADPVWLKTGEIRLKPKREDAEFPLKVSINQYFIDHPEMIVGEQSLVGTMYGENEYTVMPSADFDFEKALSEALSNLPQGIFQGADKVDQGATDSLPPEKKEGSFYLKDDKLWQVDENGLGKQVVLRGGGIGGVTKADMEKIKMLVPLRNALRRTLSAMHEGALGPIAKAQQALNRDYTAFTEKYGPLNKVEYQTRRPSPAAMEEARNEARDAALSLGEEFSEGDADLTEMARARDEGGKKKFTNSDIGRERQRLRDLADKEGRAFNEGSFDPASVEDDVTEKYPNLDAFRSDPEVYTLMILEDYDIETATATKREIFTQNILAKQKEPDIRSAVDALHYALNVRNAVDPAFMAQKLGVTIKDILDDLVSSNQIYLDPASLTDGNDIWATTDDYLAGNVKAKLKAAQDAARQDERFERNVKALKSVQPEDVPVSDITVAFGTPFIPTGAIEDFMDQQLEIVAYVRFYPATNSWTVDSGERRSAESQFKYGTSRMSAVDIVSKLLNKQEITVFDYLTNPDGSKVAKINTVETEGAQEKARLIEEKFAGWIWKSKYGAPLHRYYNDNFNNMVERKFDGSHLTPAISPSIKLMKHQFNVIWRILQNGNTYAAHAVGAGKTLEMVVAGMEMKRLGLVKKPMYVVPNHMLGQFSKEFADAYPSAKIYVADEYRFHANRRKLFVTQVAKNDWDAVVITFSAFGKIPVSPETEAALLQREIARYTDTINQMKANGEKRTLAQIEKQKQKIEERIKALKAKGKDQAFNFEDLGVDFLFVDEAHNFRKLSFATRQGRIRGVDPTGSKMAFDLYGKSRYLETIKPGRNLVLASGTPITNTLGEAFTMQRYMDEKRLEQLHIDNFDSWAAVYATTRTKLEKQPSGAYAQVTRFARFQNLPGLSGMMRRFMDVVTSQELGRLVNRPALNTGKVQIRTSKPTAAFLDYQKILEKRMGIIKKRTGKPQKGDDIILNVINDGRHAAIDMRVINPELPPHQDSKLNDMLEQAHRIWEATKNKAYRNPKGQTEPVKGATQLIFSDLGIKKRENNGVSFSAYEWMKRRLMEMGVPAKEIAYMRDYEGHEDKRRVQLDVNQGRIRILIGSTPNMGTGMNAQRRLAAIHNLDAPWFPADLEQRIGRGLRQGNQNSTIDVFGYGTEGSYDATMWSLLETKSSFINAFLNGTNTLPEADDISDTDLYRVAEALVTGDPKVLRRAELIDEINRLERKLKSFDNEQAYGRFKMQDNDNGIEFRQTQIAALKKAITQRTDTEGEKFSATINGLNYDERKAAGEALLDHVMKLVKQNGTLPPQGVEVGQLAGFPIIFSHDKNAMLGDPFHAALDTPLNDEYAASWGKILPTPLGLIRQLETAPRRFESRIEQYHEEIEKRRRDNKIIGAEQQGAFPKQKELDEKKAEFKAIEDALQKQSSEQVVDMTPPAGEAANEMAIDGDEIRLSVSRVMLKRGEFGSTKKVAVGLIGTKPLTLTQDQHAAIDLVHKELGKLAPMATPQFFERLEVDRDGGEEPLLVDGAYYRSFGGGGVSHVIAWAMDSKDPVSTARHEAIHYFRRSGLITKPEWQVLSKTAEDRGWLTKHEIPARYPDFNSDIQTEEAVADEFADWRKGIEDRFGKLPGRVARTFRKMDLFRRRTVAGLRELLGKAPTAEDLFTKMQTGEVGQRKPSLVTAPVGSDAPLFARKKRAGPEVPPGEENPGEPLESRLAALRTRLQATSTPHEYVKELVSEAGSILPARAIAFLDGTFREAAMGINPMSEGAPKAIALAKDYANSVRLADWRYNELFEKLTSEFKPDIRKTMWEKMDETSVWAQDQQAKSTQPLSYDDLAEMAANKGIGIYSLPPRQRDVLLTLNKAAQRLYQQAQDTGMVQGDGIPFWTPRMAVFIGKDGTFQTPYSGDGKPTLDAKGLNFSTYSPNLKQRKHLHAEDTEAAMKAKLGDEAIIAKDIRAMPFAMRRLERALAGRAFINRIKSISAVAGYETVRDSPAEGFFTLDHPAFKSYRPRLVKQADGKWHHMRDENGVPLFDQYNIYVSKQFEGPLRAILASRAPLWYRGLMGIKSKTIGLIMYSPFMHNAVEWGRAMPAAPGKVASMRIYFEGNAAKRGIDYSGVLNHIKGKHKADFLPSHPMEDAIKDGMVPIGHRAFNQDITSTVEEPSLNPGRSTTAKVLGGLSDGMMRALFGRARGVSTNIAVRTAIDAMGDFYHNKLLWDRVGDLQMGLYVHFRDMLVRDGYDIQTAGRMAAHFANRYAGALPLEAMSEASRRLANVMMFSRTFTLGNLGVMKDVFSGLPADISAQIERDAGEAVLKLAKNTAAKKSFRIFALDIAMMRITNMLLTAALGVMLFDQDIDDVLKGYVRRFADLLNHLEKSPLDLVPEVITAGESLDPTFDNEPGKTNRILFTHDEKGTAYYLRFPTGKVGEDFTKWLTRPLQTMKDKESALLKSVAEVWANEDFAGHAIYDKNQTGFIAGIENIGRAVGHILGAQESFTDIFKGAQALRTDLKTGTGSVLADAMRTFGPLAGITVSKGYPGGPAVGEQAAVIKAHNDAIEAARPDFRQLIERGDTDKAVAMMEDLDMTKGEIKHNIKMYEQPDSRINKSSQKKFEQSATPDQKARFQRDLENQQ